MPGVTPEAVGSFFDAAAFHRLTVMMPLRSKNDDAPNPGFCR
jgi:hypothetical protein